MEGFRKTFTKENILNELAKRGLYEYNGRIMLGGEAKPYTAKVSLVQENGEDTQG